MIYAILIRENEYNRHGLTYKFSFLCVPLPPPLTPNTHTHTHIRPHHLAPQIHRPSHDTHTHTHTFPTLGGWCHVFDWTDNLWFYDPSAVFQLFWDNCSNNLWIMVSIDKIILRFVWYSFSQPDRYTGSVIPLKQTQQMYLDIIPEQFIP